MRVQGEPSISGKTSYIADATTLACNINCYYCRLKHFDITKSHRKYNFYEIVKYLLENNLFMPNANIRISGGEPVLNPYFAVT